jgi:AcrR family transcriptional regulator
MSTKTDGREGEDSPTAESSTRSRIIAEAARMFRSVGYTATTTRDLADAVGIRGPSLYHYFPTKMDLLYGVCEESLRRLSEASEEVDGEDLDARQELMRRIEIHLETIVRDLDMHATMLIEMRALSGKMRRSVVRSRDAYEGVIRGTVERAQEEDVLRTDINAHDLTLTLLNTLNWTVIWFDPRGPLGSDKLAELYANVFLEGAEA